MKSALPNPRSPWSLVPFPSGRPDCRVVTTHSHRRPARSAIEPRIEPLEARRLFSAGALDPTFGSGGLASSSLFTAADAALQADGKILVVGTKVGRNGVPDFAVARFNANGSLDGTFGSGGVSVTPVFINNTLVEAHATGVNVLAGGRIVVTGRAGSPVGDSPGPIPDQFAAIRYNANGSVDATFGTGGQAVSNLDPSATNGYGLDRTGGAAVLADGDIVVLGHFQGVGPDNHGDLLAAFTPQGKIDATFTGSGRQVPIEAGSGSRSIAALPGNRVIVVGSAPEVGTGDSGAGTDQAFAVFNSGGTLAYTKTNAFINPMPGPSPEVANALAVAPLAGGGYLTAGLINYATENNGQVHFTLAEYDSSGSRSPALSGGHSPWGVGTEDTSINGNDIGEAVAVAPGGKILEAGMTDTSAGGALGLVRYNPDGSLDSTFGSGGKAPAVVNGGVNVVINVFALPGGKALVVDDHEGNLELLRYQGDPTATTATVAGTVYNDANGNGARNTGEAGLAGVQVYVDLTNSGVYRAGDPTTTTNSAGAYTLTGVAPGNNVIIRQVPPKGYHQTFPGSGFGHHLALLAGQTVTGQDFGDKL